MTTRTFRHAGLFATGIGLALGAVAANAVTVNTDTFQGVTFTTTSIDGDNNSIILRIQGTGTGDWTGVRWLSALSIDPPGTVTSATISPFGTFSGGELNANGCGNGNSGKACFLFSPWLVLDPDNDKAFDQSFTIDFVGTSLDMTGIFSVKVNFQCALTETQKCGSNYSQEVYTSSSGGGSSGGSSGGEGSSSSSSGTQVPEPSSSLVLLGLGLIGLGFARRVKARA